MNDLGFRWSINIPSRYALHVSPRLHLSINNPPDEVSRALLSLESVDSCEVSRNEAGSAGQHTWALTFLQVGLMEITKPTKVRPKSTGHRARSLYFDSRSFASVKPSDRIRYSGYSSGPTHDFLDGIPRRIEFRYDDWEKNFSKPFN